MACAGTFLESQVASPRAVGRLRRSPRMGPCAHRVALACAGRRNGARTDGFFRLREAAKSLIHAPYLGGSTAVATHLVGVVSA